jgi:transcriptional regulator with XRE-family HTH domain
MPFDRQGFDREVGLLLQLARKRKDKTQGELAAALGMNRASYANIEAGRQRIPLDVVWRVAVVLGVSIASLVPEAIKSSRREQPSETRAIGNTTSTSIADLLVKRSINS